MHVTCKKHLTGNCNAGTVYTGCGVRDDEVNFLQVKCNSLWNQIYTISSAEKERVMPEVS
jgi:hypothetical protein